MNSAESGDASHLERRGMEAIVRLGAAVILLAWCFQILRPFIQPIAWGMIIAVATHGLYQRIARTVGGRHRLAATLYVLLAMVVLMVPVLLLAGTLVDGVSYLANDLKDGFPDITRPPASVADWPLIGKALYEFWKSAAVNLRSALDEMGVDLTNVGSWLLSKAAGVGMSLVLILLSIVIAGVLLAHAGSGGQLARDIATRLVGNRGEEFATLATTTVRSVARGILGVALIQSILAGIGFLAVGLPAAGLCALIVLFAAVVQLPVFLVLLPLSVYVFALTGATAPEGAQAVGEAAAPAGEAAMSMTAAVVFAVWCVVVSTVDNILKPILLGRGAPVPMLVIFIGVIGGFVVDGIIGLFTGAIVLSLGYKLFQAWLRPQDYPSGGDEPTHGSNTASRREDEKRSGD